MPKKLLVADDSLTIQKVIRLALSGAGAGHGDGYEIQTVSDGNDAIQQISLFRPDVVLIDVSLPGKTAFEVKRAINVHNDLERVRFVLMSSAFEKVDEEQVKEVVFQARLTKPFDPAHLREILSQVLSSIPKPAPNKGLPKEPLLGYSGDGPEIKAPATNIKTSIELPPEPPSFSSGVNVGAKEHAPPPPPSFHDVASSEPENDIRQLTQSTIQMSGLDDMLPPTSSSQNTGQSTNPTFNNEFGFLDMAPEVPEANTVGAGSGFDLGRGPPEPPHSFSIDMESNYDWSVQENSLKPPPLADAGGTTFPGAPPSHSGRDTTGFIGRTQNPPKMESLDLPLSPPPTGNNLFEPLLERNETPPPPYQTPMPAADMDQGDEVPTAIAMPNFDEIEKRLEDFVRQEISRAIRELTHKELVAVTERIVKEEIHKLLSESP